MKESYKYLEELLRRWYAGDADPELTREIIRLLRQCGDIPECFQQDREMFLALDEAMSDPVEMPMEYSDRIDAALAAEMQRGGIFASSHRRRTRKWLYAAAAAVSLLIAVAGMRIGLMDADDVARQERYASAMSALSSQASGRLMTEDTIRTVFTVDNTVVSADSRRTDKPESRNGAGKNTGMAGRGSDLTPEESADSPRTIAARESAYRDSVSRSADEFAEYIASNYRVVDNYAEASAIVNGIFASVDSRMVEVSCDVSDISADYNMHISNIQGI